MDNEEKRFTLDDVISAIAKSSVGKGMGPVPSMVSTGWNSITDQSGSRSPEAFSGAPGTQSMPGNYDIITDENKFNQFMKKNEQEKEKQKSENSPKSEGSSYSPEKELATVHPDAVVADSIIKGAGARLADPSTYEGMNPSQLAQTVRQAAGVKQQTMQQEQGPQTGAEALSQAPFTPLTLDQEYAARVSDMTGIQNKYNEPVPQGKPGLADKAAYFLGGVESPKMREALEFGGARGRGYGGMGPELEKSYLTAQAPLGTYEQAQLELQERLGMAERGIQQQQKSKERAEVARSTMFPGTQWIPFLQPQALKTYLGTGGPGTRQYAEATKEKKVSEQNIGKELVQRPNLQPKQIESYNKLRSRGLSREDALSRVQGGK